MNIFDIAVSQNKVSSEADLKKLFRLLVKRVHPDYSGNSCDFIELKKDYEVSLLQILERKNMAQTMIFFDLIIDTAFKAKRET